ncbi:endonuclease MutS2 [Halobacillus sp. Marseille-Q1614]|uniref:endonuclease MutS2 n=1 Tax=Halobacillus sp. Marseille-Q1614 TaxID=2709134 RepID=UPI00156E8951|nr:endonuclease MutS2 [Halobacillus sp. Marseille-Q1614]
MNQQTFENVNFIDILNEVSTYALTEQGKKAIHALTPSRDKKRIDHLHREIEEAKAILHVNSHVPIHSLNEIHQMVEQGKKGMYIRPSQFTHLLSFLEHCTKLKRFMKDKQIIAPMVSSYAYSIGELDQLEEEIARSIRHGQVDDYATPSLAKLRKQMQHKREKIKEKIQQMTKSPKVVTHLQEKRVIEKNGKLTLPIKRESRNKLKGTIVDQSASGATLFIEPSEITSQQEDLHLLKMQEEQEIEQILYSLTSQVLSYEQDLSIAVETMLVYDVIFAKAKYSRMIKGESPIINNEDIIDLKNACHPLLGESAVPLTILLDKSPQGLLITGPNTGGKTVTLKTVGLLSLMAQTGLSIPADKGSSLPIFQHILVDIGDGQSIQENLSTFSSRLVNIIGVLQQTNDQSLVLLDEIGSGTDPGEGMGLAIAILDQLAYKGAKILATTHYSEMKDYAQDKEGFVNAAMEFDLESLQPTYKLIQGSEGKSQAFDIAQKLGLHPQILEKAYEITYKSKKNFTINSEELAGDNYTKQMAANRYRKKSKEKTLMQEAVTLYKQGDNVKILATGETAIVYKGPDEKGDYVVQQKGEKFSLNHKRIRIHIPAEELYPEDYDFDIVFKSKEYRKKKREMDRKYVEGEWLNSEE